MTQLASAYDLHPMQLRSDPHPRPAAWALAIPAVASYSQILGGADRSASGVLLWAFVVGGLLSATEFMSEAGTATVADWMSDWPMLEALRSQLGAAGVAPGRVGGGGP